MSKCKIECPVHELSRREFEVTSDGKVWPCCYFANAWDTRFDKGSSVRQDYEDDKTMQELEKAEPGWNDLSKHSLDDIVDHEIFWTHLWFPGWEGDTPPNICVTECSVYIDEITGKETTPSRLDT